MDIAFKSIEYFSKGGKTDGSDQSTGSNGSFFTNIHHH